MTELMNSSTAYCMFVTLETEKVTSSRSMVSNIGIALTQACNTSWLPKTIAQGRTKPDSYRCKWRHASPSSPLLLALWIICICHSATRSHIGSPEYWINGSTILVSIAFLPVFFATSDVSQSKCEQVCNYICEYIRCLAQIVKSMEFSGSNRPVSGYHHHKAASSPSQYSAGCIPTEYHAFQSFKTSKANCTNRFVPPTYSNQIQYRDPKTQKYGLGSTWNSTFCCLAWAVEHTSTT